MFSRILGKKKGNAEAQLDRNEEKAQALLRQGANVAQKIKAFTKKYGIFLSTYFIGATNLKVIRKNIWLLPRKPVLKKEIPSASATSASISRVKLTYSVIPYTLENLRL